MVMENSEYKRDRTIKDITDPKEQEEIIKTCKVCHISFVDGDKPYGLAFCFGYENNSIYLHTALAGKKLDILRKNNNVCVVLDTGHELFYRHEHVACSWRMRYRSVVAIGKAEFIEDYDEKIKGLEIFMRNYAERDFEFSKPSVDNIKLIRINIEEMTGRSFEYQN